ncbi:MAG: TIM-barrel domain-containing protein [Rhodanobacter sp.]
MAVHLDANGMTIDKGSGTAGVPLAIHFDGTGIVHVRSGAIGQPALVLDPHSEQLHAPVQVREDAHSVTMRSGQLTATWSKDRRDLSVDDASGHHLLTFNPLTLSEGKIALMHAQSDALYGIHGFNNADPATAGLLRSGNQLAKAGEQGNAGAPFVWSTAGYGVLLGTDDNVDFNLDPTRIDIDVKAKVAQAKSVVDFYILVGHPHELFAELAQLSGHAPLFPKWALGFMNSQWGIDQKELLSITNTYRAKHIPVDNFIFDFDWKAWGQDNYGEFRWNATKFPDGPNGKLKAELDSRGLHMSGIMKPRIHVDTVEGRYATAHNLWVSGKPTSTDYFSFKPVRDIDFDLPAARAWFFNDALKHSFDTGIVGWWNDEADDTDSNTQFMNMQRAIYDGQRAYSSLRAWSINRNFWLGSQRYAYGLWSGDILTGFASMAGQRQRMLSAINLGAMEWGMDGGGFVGHPSDENYARWIEFGAFTPIFRVHGTSGEKRQPWHYGLIAEKAATKAIRLRYALIPYIYASEHANHVRGVGMVRPLIFDYPDDPQVRNDVDAWMFGDSLLVAPVVEQGQTVKHIYLPAGRWVDWFKGTVYQGGRTIDYPIDSTHWADIPLFIRDGAIIPTQEAMDYVGEHPVVALDVDVFPSDTLSYFDYYDDDGKTYAYEHGDFFTQHLSTQHQGDAVVFNVDAPGGTFKPALKYYLVKMHGVAAASVTAGQGELKHAANLEALRAGDGEGWAIGSDRYGPVTWVKLAAGIAQQVTLHAAATH